MTEKHTLSNLVLLALKYAQAGEEAAYCKLVLQGGCLAWRKATSNTWSDIERGPQKWDAMMAATQAEYSDFQKSKLLATVKDVI